MPVNLPVASSSHQEAPKPVAITLMKDGTISIGDTVVGIEEIKPRVEQLADKADTPVILRADENVEHGKVIKVMDEIKSAGVNKIIHSYSGEIVNEKTYFGKKSFSNIFVFSIY